MRRVIRLWHLGNRSQKKAEESVVEPGGCARQRSLSSSIRRARRRRGFAVAGLGLLAALLCAQAARAQHAAGLPPHGDAQPGYLGVSLLDLDPDTVARLHLKTNHGALIVTIDRDAPAATAGLHAHDVVVEINTQRVDNVEQLRRALHDTTAGTNITLRISRDGAEQTIAVQLGDEAEITARAWEQHFSAAPGMGSNAADGQSAQAAPSSDVGTAPAAGSGGARGRASSFLGAFLPNPSYTGAEIDPLSTQLAEYFGVHDGAGLLVRTVSSNSPASAAGLKAGDVILRVNNQPVVSRVDWLKQLHANKGRAVQLSVMRNRREQVLTMTAGNGKKG